MTPEEHARQVLGHDDKSQICLLSVATLASVIRAAVAEEREACAKAVDALIDGDAPLADPVWDGACERAAEEIRARGK